MQDNYKNNYDEISNISPDCGDVGAEDFDLRNDLDDDFFDSPPDYGYVPEDLAIPNNPEEDYLRELREERMEQIQNSTITKENNFLPPAVEEQADASNCNPSIKDYSLECCQTKKRDRRRDFVFEVDPDEIRCVIRDCK